MTEKAMSVKEALEEFEERIKKNEKDTDAWCDRGSMLANLGKYEEAEKSFKKAIELDPKLDTAWNNLGALYFGYMGKPKEGKKCFEEALKLNPHSVGANYNMGRLMIAEAEPIKDQDKKKMKYLSAISYINQALTTNPEHAQSWYNKACAHSMTGQAKDAIKALVKAVELQPEYKEMAKKDSDFDPIRQNKYFQEAIA